ncbi:MAG: ATP synthase F1 subunit delta [Deltaproteobacteria bacterium]|jgi:F-type H+-transporting ATPase subunit delta|nr:ATP synthase F1 subunit delta [Deltaproteobacteria bacterium]
MNKILAKRYARALLTLGVEDGHYQSYLEDLNGFVEALEAAGPSGAILSSPVYPRKLRSEILEKILEAASIKGILANFLRLLHDRDRFTLLPAVAECLRDLIDEREGKIRGILTTASPLKSSEISAIEGALGTMTGRKVELRVREDPSIIGGLVAHLGDLVVDSSLRTQLNKLGRRLVEV